MSSERIICNRFVLSEKKNDQKMGLYEEEFKSVLKLGMYLGQLPLVQPEANKIEDINIKFLSFNTVYYIIFLGIVTGNWLTDLADYLSTGRNFLLGYKLIVNLITIRVSIGLKCILLSIEEFDSDLYSLRRKKFFFGSSKLEAIRVVVACCDQRSNKHNNRQTTSRASIRFVLCNVQHGEKFFLLVVLRSLCKPVNTPELLEP